MRTKYYQKTEWNITNETAYAKYQQRLLADIDRCFEPYTTKIKTSDIAKKILKNDITNRTGARGTAKSTLFTFIILHQFLCLNWYNAAIVRKTQTQSQAINSNIIFCLNLMIENDIIDHTFMKQFRYIGKSGYEHYEYNNRLLLFGSTRNFNNFRSFTATKGTFIDIFWEEYIEDMTNASKIEITTESQIKGANSIRSSLFRGNINAIRYGIRHEFYGANAYDDTHPWYLRYIEKPIPVDITFNEKTNIGKQASANINELINGNHYIIKEWTDEYNKHILSIRETYHIIPASRWTKEQETTKETLRTQYPNIYAVDYLGIPAFRNDIQYTYRMNMMRNDELGNIRYNKLENIDTIWPNVVKCFIGIDRGTNRDDTAFCLTAIVRNTQTYPVIVHKAAVLSVFTLKGLSYQNDITRVYGAFLEWWKNLVETYPELKDKTERIAVDTNAIDFKNYFASQLYRHHYTNKLIVVSALNKSTRVYNFNICDRVDAMKRLLSNGDIYFNDNDNGVRELIRDMYVCKNNDKNERDERPGKNKLDRINALEYSIFDLLTVLGSI